MRQALNLLTLFLISAVLLGCTARKQQDKDLLIRYRANVEDVLDRQEDARNRASGQSVVKTARSAIGTPYVRGGRNPGGFDCSGLVQWAYQSVGVKLPRTAEIASLFASMIPYFDTAVKPQDDFMNLKLQEGVLALLHIDKRFAPMLFDFNEPWKIDILDFMNENYMYEFSMEELAHYTGRSLATFKRDFKKISDLTPEKWLIRKRLEVAYALMKEGGKRIVDVYTKVGFKNQSHFSAAFKRQYGVSPTSVSS